MAGHKRVNIGIALLAFAYVLSQFFRAFLAVLSPFLERDLGTTPQDLAFASGLWFIAFAALQPPIGWALDTHGPRRTAAGLMLLGAGGGSAVFALATTPLHLSIAMTLIGVGCAPVLMASFYIFALDHPAKRFAFLAALMVGIGTLGNLVASYPMTLAAETIGWRASMWVLCAASSATAIGIFALVRDPVKAPQSEIGSFAAVMRIRALWFIFPLMLVSYAEVGALRGLWIGPYLAEVFSASPRVIGQASLAMGLAMVVGPMAYSAADRVFPSRKWIIFGGSVLMLGATLALVGAPDTSPLYVAAMMCLIGFFGSTYPAVMAHGRSFLPSHLVGRGVTMLNLCSIGGVGLAQFATGRIYSSLTPAEHLVRPYTMILVFFAALLTLGLLAYLFSRDAET